VIFDRHTIPNAIRALFRAGFFAAKNKTILASAATERSRLEKCAHCPQLDMAAMMQCRACSCFVRLKVQLASESCPLQKW
jgi:hypothetical protein